MPSPSFSPYWTVLLASFLRVPESGEYRMPMCCLPLIQYLDLGVRSPISNPQCRPKAKVASRVRENFLKMNCKRLQRFSAPHAYVRYREAVKASEERQIEFKDWVVASKDFSKDEKAALNVDSVVAFEDFWQNTNTAKADFDSGKERGCGLCVKRYQSSAAFISPFMKDFSPIVQIVRDFGAPYGAVAVGTMSLLFAVSVDFLVC